MLSKKIRISAIVLFLLFFFGSYSQADKLSREERRKQGLEELQKHFEWWPTDAKPGPVRDPAAHRWKYLYELNKDRIKDPNKLKVGKKIIIPIE